MSQKKEKRAMGYKEKKKPFWLWKYFDLKPTKSMFKML